MNFQDAAFAEHLAHDLLLAFNLESNEPVKKTTKLVKCFFYLLDDLGEAVGDNVWLESFEGSLVNYLSIFL